MRDKKLLRVMAMGISMVLALQPMVAFAGEDEFSELTGSAPTTAVPTNPFEDGKTIEETAQDALDDIDEAKDALVSDAAATDSGAPESVYIATGEESLMVDEVLENVEVSANESTAIVQAYGDAIDYAIAAGSNVDDAKEIVQEIKTNNATDPETDKAVEETYDAANNARSDSLDAVWGYSDVSDYAGEAGTNYYSAGNYYEGLKTDPENCGYNLEMADAIYAYAEKAYKDANDAMDKADADLKKAQKEYDEAKAAYDELVKSGVSEEDTKAATRDAISKADGKLSEAQGNLALANEKMIYAQEAVLECSEDLNTARYAELIYLQKEYEEATPENKTVRNENLKASLIEYYFLDDEAGTWRYTSYDYFDPENEEGFTTDEEGVAKYIAGYDENGEPILKDVPEFLLKSRKIEIGYDGRTDVFYYSLQDNGDGTFEITPYDFEIVEVKGEGKGHYEYSNHEPVPDFKFVVKDDSDDSIGYANGKSLKNHTEKERSDYVGNEKDYILEGIPDSETYVTTPIKDDDGNVIKIEVRQYGKFMLSPVDDPWSYVGEKDYYIMTYIFQADKVFYVDGGEPGPSTYDLRIATSVPDTLQVNDGSEGYKDQQLYYDLKTRVNKTRLAYSKAQEELSQARQDLSALTYKNATKKTMVDARFQLTTAEGNLIAAREQRTTAEENLRSAKEDKKYADAQRQYFHPVTKPVDPNGGNGGQTGGDSTPANQTSGEQPSGGQTDSGTSGGISAIVATATQTPVQAAVQTAVLGQTRSDSKKSSVAPAVTETDAEAPAADSVAQAPATEAEEKREDDLADQPQEDAAVSKDTTTPQTATSILNEESAKAASPEKENNKARTAVIVLGAGVAAVGIEEIFRRLIMRKV